MESWKIGDVEIHRVVDLLMDMPTVFLFPEGSPDELTQHHGWLIPHFLQADGQTMTVSVHTFVIRSGDATIVVDTCIGNNKERDAPNWNKRNSDFLERLSERGAARAAVDMVLCTHLHVDHVGWNTILENDRWVPTFPKAKYLIGREEWAFWEHEDDPFGKQAKADSILPIVESDLVQFVETDHRLTDEVCLVPTPGHTPGHVSVLIRSRGEQAIITGDLFHHPLQFAHPGWKDIADVDGETAERTRHAFMHQYGDETLVLGTHFASPTAGHIVRDGEFWRFDV
jgi:glyoxylase-like metal-dependent hydrolase (beta-lactamase superfamily II)|tara:strand:+ start:1382 stop:2233 length:852 start_codon:yes stop_codon:yes gene_type:complete